MHKKEETGLAAARSRLTAEEIVSAIEEILWGRHERGFIMGPLIGRDEMIVNEVKRLKLLDVRF